MSNFLRRPKKSIDFETEVLERLESLQIAQAKSKQDFHVILREEVTKALKDYHKRGWYSIL